jgi:ankyrin repeat protein
MRLHHDDPNAAAAIQAIHTGDLAALKRALEQQPGLATAHIACADGGGRTLLHVATDWPGHFPGVAASIAALVEAGADVNARFTGAHNETPLHWAASSNDIEALDALLDAGADMEADGAVIGGGTPLADARGFAQWGAARRLLERGARPSFNDAATLGLIDELEAYLAATPPPAADAITRAFWAACHGGQLRAAEILLARGPDIDWVGWGHMTPLDVARAPDAEALAGPESTRALLDLLEARGARSAKGM